MKSSSRTVPQHPFSKTSAKLELLQTPSGIDVEEEARLYDELIRSNDYEASLTDTGPRIPFPQSAKASFPAIRPTHRPRQRSHSLPPESIFSAEIFLVDNTGRNSSDSPPLFAQDVQISGWSIVGDGAPKLGHTGKGASIGGGAYVVYDCVITTKEGTTMHLLKRYSAFEELRAALKRSLPPSLVPCVPALPPKSALARFRPAFLDSRRKLLQFFLVSVLLHPDIGGREVVRRWVLT